jgi:hypothetical protein
MESTPRIEMNTIRGTYLNGMIVPDTRPEWVEGSRVSVNLAEAKGFEDEDSPEAIARRLAVMDELLDISPMPDEEIEAWERQRVQAKARELASWDERMRRIGAEDS